MAPNATAASSSLHMWHLRALIEEEENQEIFDLEFFEDSFFETVSENNWASPEDNFSYTGDEEEDFFCASDDEEFYFSTGDSDSEDDDVSSILDVSSDSESMWSLPMEDRGEKDEEDSVEMTPMVIKLKRILLSIANGLSFERRRL